MSGLSFASILTHSTPFEASPIIWISSAASSSLRRPSRKMAWSSATRMRITCFAFVILIQWNFDG